MSGVSIRSINRVIISSVSVSYRYYLSVRCKCEVQMTGFGSKFQVQVLGASLSCKFQMKVSGARVRFQCVMQMSSASVR